MEDIGVEQSSTITATLDVTIQDFFTATEKICEFRWKKYEKCTMLFLVSVFPNIGKNDCLLVRVRATAHNAGRYIEVGNLKWAVSIIDIEGRKKFTQYFGGFSDSNSTTAGDDYSAENMSLASVSEEQGRKEKFAESSYLKKSFILNRSDDLISDGKLLLRFDIYIDSEIMKFQSFLDLRLLTKDNFFDFFRSIPQVYRLKNSAETDELSQIFDFTSQILTLPQFHELRKRFGDYGIPPVSQKSSDTEPKEGITDILEDVWIFDTLPDRFLLSIARPPDNVGYLLVNSSPVIRGAVETPMKEQLEKRIEFSDVKSLTFLIVLYFLKSGEISVFSVEEIMLVYKFSHFYGMEILNQNCAKYITSHSKTETQLSEIEQLAKLYSDDYLLIWSQSQKRKNFEHLVTKDDGLNSDCYK